MALKWRQGKRKSAPTARTESNHAYVNRPIGQSPQPGTVNLEALKARQHGAWSSGDYAIVGTTLQIVGEELCEALDLRSGRKVLDVAAGNGNATLAAARRWCDVVSTDYVPSLLERGRIRAAAEGLSVEFREADAEALPFADASFDAVVSTFGVMFTPNQDKAAAELLRVCKSGGKIGMANWTPEGFIGPALQDAGQIPAAASRCEVARAVGHAGAHHGDVRDGFRLHQGRATQFHVPLPLARALPGRLQDLLWPDAQSLCGARRGGQRGLATDLLALIGKMNRAEDGTMVVASEYLEIVIAKR
jgi:SAM-dependent methyltransferase